MRILILALALPALILFAAYGDDDEEDVHASPTVTVAPTRAPTPSAAPTPTPDPLAGVCADNPDPGTADVVQVDTPDEGDSVSSPVAVRGIVAAFEATFQITIFDADGTVIADVTAMSSEGQTLAPFAEEVPFSVTEQTPACLWVYEKSARDGNPIHVVQIPVLLQP